MSAQAVSKSLEAYRHVPQPLIQQPLATIGKFLLQADQRVQRIGSIVEQAFIVFIHGTESGEVTTPQKSRLLKKAAINIPDFEQKIYDHSAAKLSYPAYLFHLHLNAYKQSDIALPDVKEQISELIGEINDDKAKVVMELEPEKNQYLDKQLKVSSETWISRVEKFKNLMNSRKVLFTLLSKKAVLVLLLTGQCRGYLDKSYVEKVIAKGDECPSCFFHPENIKTLKH
ncbi:MAG: hypothetical protein HAW66_00500 [Shewanella sp.]|nr:hypothetical protein [Shewanella sp.]